MNATWSEPFHVPVLILATVLAASGVAHASGERLTEHCNRTYGSGEVYLETSDPASFLAIVAQPHLNPEAYHRMWRPHDGMELRNVLGTYAVLRFDRVQDTSEIARSIHEDPLLRGLGVVSAYGPTYGTCFSPQPPALRRTVTEYYNRILGHYFLSSTPEENAAIDSGAAGPGWERTGESFQAVDPDFDPWCYDVKPVFRFYGPGPNSHFFTAHSRECGGLRQPGTGWLYEGESFSAAMPVGGICPKHMPTPVFRAYNNRWMFNDSNHRFTTSLVKYQAMVAAGWVGEGVALCVMAPGS